LNLALSECRQTRHQNAVYLLDSLIRLEPLNDTAYNNRGLCKHHLGGTQNALRDVDFAISLNDSNAGYFINAGSFLMTLRDFKRSHGAFSSALRLDSMSSAAWNGRAIAKYELGRYGEAIIDMTKAINIEPSNSEFLLSRAKLLLKTGNKTYACKDILKAAKLGNQEALEFPKSLCNTR